MQKSKAVYLRDNIEIVNGFAACPSPRWTLRMSQRALMSITNLRRGAGGALYWRNKKRTLVITPDFNG
jgi:hypothetical protein